MRFARLTTGVRDEIYRKVRRIIMLYKEKSVQRVLDSNPKIELNSRRSVAMFKGTEYPELIEMFERKVYGGLYEHRDAVPDEWKDHPVGPAIDFSLVLEPGASEPSGSEPQPSTKEEQKISFVLDTTNTRLHNSLHPAAGWKFTYTPEDLPERFSDVALDALRKLQKIESNVASMNRMSTKIAQYLENYTSLGKALKETPQLEPYIPTTYLEILGNKWKKSAKDGHGYFDLTELNRITAVLSISGAFLE